MKKVSIVVFSLVLVLMFALTGCASSVEDTQQSDADTSAQTSGEEAATTTEATGEFDTSQYTLGFVCLNRTNPTVQLMMAGFLAEAEALGYTAELYVASTANIADAVALGEQAVAKGVDGLIIYYLDDSTMALIKRAAEADIAVVSGHTDLGEDPSAYEGLLAWASCDPVAYADAVGKAIGDAVNGTGTVAITQGSFNPTENAVTAEFIVYMAENYPNITVLDPIEEGFESVEAVTRCASLIQGNPDIVGAFSTTGSGAVSWANAMGQTGVSGLAVVGMDYTRQNLDLIKSGTILGIVAQPIYEEHAYCVDLLDKILRGEDVEFVNVMDAPLVTADNVDDFYTYLEIVEEYFGAESGTAE